MCAAMARRPRQMIYLSWLNSCMQAPRFPAGSLFIVSRRSSHVFIVDHIRRDINSRNGNTDLTRRNAGVRGDAVHCFPGDQDLTGRGHIRRIAAKLIAAGRPADTPIAAISAAGRPEQQVLRGTLEDLPAPLPPPVTFVVGEAAALNLVACTSPTAS